MLSARRRPSTGLMGDMGARLVAGVEIVGEFGPEETSAASICMVWPLSVSVDLTDCAVFRRWRWRFTSILLLKYVSRQSSKVMTRPSSRSLGIATSSNLSLTNLWSSAASSLPVWYMSIFNVSSGSSSFPVINVKASDASCWHNCVASSQPHLPKASCRCLV